MPTFIKRPHVSTYGEIKNVVTETAITQDNTGTCGTLVKLKCNFDFKLKMTWLRLNPRKTPV